MAKVKFYRFRFADGCIIIVRGMDKQTLMIAEAKHGKLVSKTLEC